MKQDIISTEMINLNQLSSLIENMIYLAVSSDVEH